MAAPVFDKIILHIGAEKTGTSTIQRFLSANRDRLGAQNIYYPHTPGEENHTRLAVAAQNSVREQGFLRQEVGDASPQALAAFQETFLAALHAELADAAAAGFRRLIFSGEHCHTRVKNAEEAARLANLLRPLARKVRVLFYVRRQDEVAVSLYSTALRAGYAHTEPDLSFGAQAHRFNYHAACSLYEDTFGQGALTVRLYDKEAFQDQNLLSDFCFAAGILWDAGFCVPPRRNEALPAEAQRLLAYVNTQKDGVFAPSGRWRGMLLERLEALPAAPSVQPTRSEAERFVAQYQDSNEAVRARYRPDLSPPLFGMDFSAYPTVKPQGALPAPEAQAQLRRLFADRPDVLADLSRADG
ncbi:hypothetical protein ACFO5Q_15265 [Kordiimonas lipolytica]|uniref:Sulfotransferase family protein n=1 Tax=Kordiimonas lipolytica TaxID=1662421 RepID=A0ABV8UEY0_9PROT|nr:hypothetical protein [Kordiimonas lipolytica]